MALRLILVGAVAGLGLGLPSRECVQGWRHSAETWVYSRLAEWDARMPADESAFVVVAEPTAAPPAASAPVAVAPPATPAPVATATPTPTRPEPVTPAATPDLAAGLDAPTSPMAFDDLESTPSTPAVSISDADFDRALDGVVAELTADLRATVAGTDADFDAALNAVVAELTADLVATAAVPATPAAGRPPTARPAFEWIVVGDDLYEDLAAALDRHEADLHEADLAPPTTVPAGTKGRLAQAVRLTREAVHAWASLLHGPAVVVIPR